MSQTQPTALQRKAGAGRPAPDHGVVTPATALRLAVSRAGQEALHMALAVGDVSETRLTLGAMEGYLPAGGLYVLARRGGGVGLIALDASLLAAIVQTKTMGRVTGTAVPDRSATQTDAILARGFLTLLLESFGARLAGRPAAQWAAGFQPRDRVADLARLPHLLSDTEFRGLTAVVDIAGGLRRGRMDVILPKGAEDIVEVPQLAPREDPRAAAWQEALSQRVLECSARIEAVLHRLHMPLAEVARLQPGMMLMLPDTALDRVSLHSVDGRKTGVAKLGQVDGRRAVKLVAVPGAEDTPGADPDERSGAVYPGSSTRDTASVRDAAAPQTRALAVPGESTARQGPVARVPATPPVSDLPAPR